MTVTNIQQVMADRGTHAERMWEMFLWTLTHIAQPEVVVEIGTGNGASTRAITTAMKEIRCGVEGVGYDHNSHYIGTLYSVDFSVHVGPVFERLEELGLGGYVVRVQDYSDKAGIKFTLPIDILVIDGDHYYSSVCEDWKYWEPKVVKGGYIVFHDMVIEEVQEAFERLSNRRGYDYVIIGEELWRIGLVRKNVGEVR